MYSSDRPISSVADDKLERTSFSKQLAEAIVAFPNSDNYAIGLYGEWGCGKTSIINMTLSFLREHEDKVIAIKFNPWNFTDCNQLLNQFFVTLSSELKIKNPSEYQEKLGERIEKYSSALEYTEYIPGIGKYLKLLPSLAKGIGTKMKQSASDKLNNVSYRKQEVEDALLKFSKRILIIIDDIDRLPNEQIRFIFQLVKSVADFPNVIYLLSFDKAIVVNALKSVQSGDGNRYLEKIIQIPFELPKIKLQKIYQVLFEMLDETITLTPYQKFDQEHWNEIFENCIEPFIRTLRDVNRFINAFRFRYSTVKNEIDFIDLAGITALQIFAPTLFGWIHDNKATLVGGTATDGISISDIQQNKDKQTEMFSNIYPCNPTLAVSAIASLFPRYKGKVIYSSGYIENNELVRNMRIASEQRFDLYFRLSLDEVKIPHIDVEQSIYEMGHDELISFIVATNKDMKAIDYLSELRGNIEQIPVNRINLFVNVLFEIGGTLEGKSKTMFSTTAKLQTMYIISDLLCRIDNEMDRYRIVQNLYQKLSLSNIEMASLVMTNLEKNHGRFEGKMETEKQLITPDHLKLIEALFLKLLGEIAESNDIFSLDGSGRVLFIWDILDFNECAKFLKTKFEIPLNVVKFLSSVASSFTSSNRDYPKGYDFNKDFYERYITDEEIVDSLNEARFSQEFWELPLDAQKRAATYFYQQSHPKVDLHSMKSKYIDDQLLSWKQDYSNYIKVM